MNEESWKQQLLEIEPRCDLVVIPNAIDQDEFAELGQQRASDACAVLLLGNLCEAKGHFDALEAFHEFSRSHPGVRMLFAGEERELGAERKLKERAAELGIGDRVEFLGVVSGERKLEAFRRSGVFILPSHIENMPIVIIEAMAAALPVVATRVGAIPEMVDDNVNGILIEARDPEALGRSVDRLLSDADLRRSFGRHGANKARTKWDLEVGARATRELFESLIGTTGRQL